MKNIVITGAGVGLGRALARRFANDGDNVILLGRTAAKVEAVAAEIGAQAVAIQCDVASSDAVRKAFDQIAASHANIDVLINNAAVFEPFLLQNASDDKILSAINTNLVGPMFCIRAAIPLMARGAHIINISSESVDNDMPHLAVYQSSKAGLERLSKSLQSELAPQGIRVTTVRAGAMYEEGKTWDVDPADRMAFAIEAQGRGFNLAERPLTQFESVTGLFRAIIDLPPDLDAVSISLHARKP